LRRFADARPFRGGELSVEAIEQSVDDDALAIVERLARMELPKSRLGQNGREDDFSAIEGAVQAAEEPGARLISALYAEIKRRQSPQVNRDLA
jgi:hypothetical protein